MALINCDYPTPGRFRTVALVLAGVCGAPVTGADNMWVDQCPAALELTPDVVTPEPFRRTCADGQILLDEPGIQTLVGLDFNLDLHSASPDMMTLLGLKPVTQGGVVIGWDDCRDATGSLNIYLWREVAGDQACDPDGERQWLVTIIAWAHQVRVTHTGTFGGSDGLTRLSGRGRLGHNFDVGALQVVETGGVPECFDEPITSDCTGRTVLTTLAPPSECGLAAVPSTCIT